ncbi:MAG TPA: hypothetical protein IGS31_22395, partial [Oscillatoriales cyanobacterium M4454_W2019_049]|nr:hypothetical protein [Oscillatoriales cyanobacterium M4454_W2019_049]
GVLGGFSLATIALPKRGVKGIGLVALAVGILFAAARSIAAADVVGTITRVAGWQMALDRLWTGVGLGGVSLLYPQYRPFWGGRLGEWTGHIRSTPLQVLAEWGIGGAILAVAAIALFAYQGILWQARFRPWEMVSWARHRSSDTDRAVFVDSLFPLCLYGGCLAYAIVGWLDYSLDRPAIAGTLVLYFAVLLSRWRVPPLAPMPLLIPLAGLGFLGAAIVWLTPVRYAGLLSARGVAALRSQPPDVASCVRDLTRSSQLAPWKPESALQLGWVSGSLRWQEEKIPKETIDWWQRGIAAAPDWVFGYARLGWLLLKNDPPLAAKAFGRAIELVPAQRGVFYGLGRALLSDGQTERAIEAFALEILRDPAFVTRPLWAQPDLEPLFKQVGERLEEKYAILLKDDSLSPELKQDLHQNRGGLRWWLENYKQAREDWQEYGSETSKLVLQLASLESSESVETKLRLLPPSAAKWAIEAWLHPEHRLKRLQDAWALATPKTVSPEIVGQSLSTMNAAPNFDDWLKRGSPTQMTPLFDADGMSGNGAFEGGKLEDFPQLSENTVLTHFFADRLWRSPDYFPEFDKALQLWRTALLKAALQRE